MDNKKQKNTGIMNKMRDKMPLIIIILIVAFLATIVFEWGMNYMGLGGRSEAFAKINSREIPYQEYERIVQQQVEQMPRQCRRADDPAQAEAGQRVRFRQAGDDDRALFHVRQRPRADMRPGKGEVLVHLVG